jgi:2-keto-4-pentenoate hydratase
MDRKSLSPLMAIADLQSNAAVVHGAPIRDWRSLDLSMIPVALSVSGASLPEASKREEWQTTVTTLTWLANHAASRGHGLLEGNLVITGARIGPVSLVSEDVLVASAPGFQDITIAFRP